MTLVRRYFPSYADWMWVDEVKEQSEPWTYWGVRDPIIQMMLFGAVNIDGGVIVAQRGRLIGRCPITDELASDWAWIERAADGARRAALAA